MLSNKDIQARIRTIGKKSGFASDRAISRQCGFNDATLIGKMDTVKNTPQIGTLDKFARGLGVRIEDLIYDTTDADREMAGVWANLSEYEKTEIVVYAKMMIKEKNENIKKAA